MATAVKTGTVDVNGATLYLHRALQDVVSKAMPHEAPLHAGMSDPQAVHGFLRQATAQGICPCQD
jgi:hypothetical protein